MKSIYENATPRPVHAEPETGRGAWISGANGNWLALACGESDEEAGANAALIVHAVNNIERLEAINAELLEACSGWIDWLECDAPEDFANAGDHEAAILDRMRAAIASAQRIIGEGE